MASKKITFTNPQGHTLSARLDLPVNQKPHTCALFAHCFYVFQKPERRSEYQPGNESKRNCRTSIRFYGPWSK
jgi:hypothetical protein